MADAVQSRVGKTLLNAKVNFVFYFLTLVANFISRKVFLDHLGDDFIGLTGTLLNILGYLNLAELGVSSAIAFNLYRPLRDADQAGICRIISMLGYYYRNIGYVVSAAGVVLSGFLFFIFRDSAFRDYGVIYFAFYSFLISSLLGYFFNYKQVLLVADQRNYVVSSLFQSSNILKAVVQIFVAVYVGNFYLWIAIELLFAVAYSWVLNVRIRRVYPWLKTDVREGKRMGKERPDILRSTKQVFVHKIKDFLLTQSDQLFVFIFVSLKMVAYYGNYVLITSKVMQLFNTLLDSVLASVGNLVAEADAGRMLKVFWELMAVRYLLAGFICYCLYHLIDPFIVLWVGPEYLLGNVVLMLLMINLFIFISRGTVDNYNFAFGHFADVWAAWAELVINVGVTIVCGYFWGIPGILLGKTASMIPIIVFWKPYYLFRDGFGVSYLRYWSGTLRYLVCFALCVLVAEWVVRRVSIDPAQSFVDWGLYALAVAGVFGSLYAVCILLLCPGGRHLVARLRRR